MQNKRTDDQLLYMHNISRTRPRLHNRARTESKTVLAVNVGVTEAMHRPVGLLPSPGSDARVVHRCGLTTLLHGPAARCVRLSRRWACARELKRRRLTCCLRAVESQQSRSTVHIGAPRPATPCCTSWQATGPLLLLLAAVQPGTERRLPPMHLATYVAPLRRPLWADTSGCHHFSRKRGLQCPRMRALVSTRRCCAVCW